MKIYGYAISDKNIEDIKSEELAEIAIEASPNEFRKIAKFFQDTAKRMDEMGDSYDHEHLSDQIKEFESSPHLVTVKS